MSMRPSLPSLLALGIFAVMTAHCHRAGGERNFGAAMGDVNDLDTDDVGSVRQKYRQLPQASAPTMATLKKALEHDPRPQVRANAVTALDALPIMDLFGKGMFEQNRRDIRRYLIRALDDPSPQVMARAANALALHDLDDSGARASLQSTCSCYGPPSRTRTSALSMMRSAPCAR